ncbi:3-oxoacyl-ACP reductase FabG [Longispora albida]|uniref:3-oxoacyl-ACP reductase FabG n=1 Tax=Longispora albida TaxID=203523 RepID=UPI000476BAEE|nr:3-oxoacyl-ACP reductase FabG [Longispora albida]
MNQDQKRVAIVTGAARGIGAAVALRLAAEGHAVGVVDLTEADAAVTAAAITAAGGQALALGADVASEAEIVAAIGRVTDELGPPAILVNNAGFARDADIADMTNEEWDAVMGVCLNAAFYATRAVQPHMVAARWGRVVNVSSISALGTPGRVNYSAAKAGLIGFTKALAFELGEHGVTANVVAPGFVVSDMTAKTARLLGRDFGEHQEIAARSIPVGRVGYPEDIAHAVAYFTSEGAGFASGQVLYVAGGPRD